MPSNNKNNDAARSTTYMVSRRVVNTALISGVFGAAAPRFLANGHAALRASPQVPAVPPLVHERAWHIGDADSTTHVLGNGRAMIHELGPNITFFRAPWISTPNLLAMSLVGPERIRSVSSREEGTGIWHHKLYMGNDAVGEIVDFLRQEDSCLRRMISSSVELVFVVRGPRWADYSDRYAGSRSILGQWPNGKYVFADFQSSDPFTVQLVVPEGAQLQADAQPIQTDPREAWKELAGPYYSTRLRLAPGRNDLVIAAGADIADCLGVVDRALAEPAAQSLENTRQSWRARIAKIRAAAPQDSDDLPVGMVIDDVATLLLGYRSQAGAFAAGPFFPLFFVRDQYGVSRALLALKMFDEAKGLLAYYHSIWVVHGRIHNAQTDSPRHWFHRHENDAVEMTAYLILQAFDYLGATGDDDFIAQIFPMLEWALQAQESQLLGNMLPFNGDETYIAGGILPRVHINDGSSEATLLYLASAERLVAWAATRQRWTAASIAKHRQVFSAVKQAYTGNFLIDGKLAVNNPTRRELAPLPRFRRGVCLGQYDENCLFLATTEVADDGRYFCYNCYPKRTRQIYAPRKYFIPSVALTSSLVGYNAMPRATMAATLAQALGTFSKDGRFSWPQAKLPGYETAIVVLALLQQRNPRSREFIGHMLALRDSTGTWNEYYSRAVPQGCPCRPWESSLSLLALLESKVAQPSGA